MATSRPPRTSRRVQRRRVFVGAVAALTVAIAVIFAWPSSATRNGTGSAATTTPPTTTRTSPPRRTRLPPQYHDAPVLTLGHAVADPAAGSVDTQVLFAAGLDSSDTSTARVGAISGTTAQTLPSLPSAFHDAAGAAIGNALYVFGGGDSVGQLDAILRIDADGTSTAVGRLPAPSSDSIAATIGDTAYVVGGYNGTDWLDTIVAFTADGGPRVVAHLPFGVRYAAVGAARGKLVIAGGMTTSSHASTAVFVFDPETAAVTRVGDLPQPISHAAAVGAGGEVIVAGGQNEAHEAQSAIVAINPVTHAIRDAGTLAIPRSDAALVNAHGRLLLIGGKTTSTTLDSVSRLVPTVRTKPSSTTARTNVYAHDGPMALNPEAKLARSLVYVPNSLSDTVDVIDPATFKVIDHFAVGGLPQHVTPSWDFKTLYVDNDHGNSLTPIDPRTGTRRGPDIPVTDPYNLYFTEDGRYAIVVAEARQRLDFRDAQTMRLVKSVPVPCVGVDHMDFTADGSLALVSCEFSGQMLVVDLRAQAVRTVFTLPNRGAGPSPQDVKLSPDGTVFYVADLHENGVWEIDAHTFAITGFIPTGAGTHGLYPSRDAKYLYITNRTAGTVSVLDFASRQIVQTWTIPGGSPDMGGVSADGKVLWLSGRGNGVVYAMSTADGHLLATIPVGNGPHGLCVWPQPGRYSIGHTGITR